MTGEGNESVTDLSIRLVSADPFVSEGLVIYGGVAEDLEIAPAGPPGASSTGAVIGLGATLRRAVIRCRRWSLAVSMNVGRYLNITARHPAEAVSDRSDPGTGRLPTVSRFASPALGRSLQAKERCQLASLSVNFKAWIRGSPPLGV